MATPRTDLHRPAAFVPGNYDHILSYELPGSEPGDVGYGINCSRGGIGISQPRHAADGLCCIFEIRARGGESAMHGGAGNCTVCGAHFKYGDVWQHRATGVFVHLGHQCAGKYGMMCDRSAWELAHGRIEAARAAVISRRENAEAIARVYAENPGLEANLALNHYILNDLRDKLGHYHSLSEKQVALAAKIADELRNPKPEEVRVDAPIGRMVVRGIIVGVKLHESVYGDSLKMTVKVSTPGGSWLAWGTVPSDLQGHAGLKGCEVEFTGTVQQGDRDKFFGFFKRPAKSRIVTPSAEWVAAEAQWAPAAPVQEVAHA